MATMYDFTALSKRMVANNIDLWVSSGSHQAPFYRFYADSEGSIEVSGLNINSSNTYNFQRFNSSNSHPFYISDTGYKLAHSRSVNIAGDGSEISGIKGDQVVTVSFNDNSIDNFYYFCTSHPGMFAEFSLIESAKAGVSFSNNYLYSYQAETATWSDIVRVNRQLTGPTNNEVLQAAQVDKGEYDYGFVGSIVTGTSGDDIIRGLAGFDQLFGKSGDDLIHGGNGRDIIDGGTGSDELHGDFGWNTYKDQQDGSKDLIAIKSDQYLSNFWYGKAGNSSNGEKADFIEGLDVIDEIKIIGVSTSDISVAENVSARGVTGIGIYATGTLEAIYTGDNLSANQIQNMISGDASVSAMNNQVWSYWGDNSIPELLA